MARIYEYIGHLLKDYYYYSTNFIISHHSSKKEKSEKEEEDEYEEEYLVRKLLFNNTRDILFCDVLYILDIKSWKKARINLWSSLNQKKVKINKKRQKKNKII